MNPTTPHLAPPTAAFLVPVSIAFSTTASIDWLVGLDVAASESTPPLLLLPGCGSYRASREARAAGQIWHLAAPLIGRQFPLRCVMPCTAQ